jgi:hypothetical protein
MTAGGAGQPPNAGTVTGYQGLCPDDTGYGTSGTQVQIWTCADTSNQQWTVS